MKTINELWDELTNHPDYVTGSLWTVEDVASNFECEVEEYMEEKLNLEEIDESGYKFFLISIIYYNYNNLSAFIYYYLNYLNSDRFHS